jgi:putative N6-adenine-specific DNA methylase
VTPGLEPALAAELTELGVGAKATAGGCDVSGPPGSFVRVNVRSRLASKVWWIVDSVAAPEQLSRIALRTSIGDGPIALGISEEPGARPTIPAERWRNAAIAAWKPRTGPDPLDVQLRISRAGCSVNVDTSGELLHVRGARQETGKAPLRETLASGLLRLAGWRPGEPLWDVMCGSGTILLEAAEQCRGLQPGRARGFAFERFPMVSAESVAHAKAPGPAVPTWLKGSDLNAGALGVTRRNAKRAGIFDDLVLERLDATSLDRPAVAPGLLVANLPYGKRVGQAFELSKLYAALGARLRSTFSGWRFAFLLQEGDASLGLPMEARHAVSNGGLRCSLVTGRV